MRVLFSLGVVVTMFFARSQVAHAQQQLTVAVDAAEVDAPRFAAALAGYLGAPVELGASGARLRVEPLAEGTLRLVYVGDDGLARSRDTRASADRDETSVATALLAANLVRDESRDLLALLRAARARALTAPTPTGPTPPTRAPTPPKPRVAASAPAPHVALGVDFVPALGSSSVWLGRERRGFSLGALGSLSGGVDGLSLAGICDLALGPAHGVQLAGVLAFADRDVNGLQLSLVDVAGAGMSGVQAGLVGVSGGPTSGLQLALVDVSAGTTRGVQVGLVDVSAGKASGLQLGLVDVSGGGVEGMQLGLVNVSAGRVRGVQVGLVNVAEDADAAFGLVSVSAKGRSQLRLGVDTTALAGAEVLLGARFTHSIVSLQVAPFLSRAAAVIGVGFGGRIPVGETVHVDFDALAHLVVDDQVNVAGPDLLLQARVVLGIRIAGAFGLYAGLAYELLLSNRGAPELAGPVLVDQARDGNPVVRGWPALVGGVELF